MKRLAILALLVGVFAVPTTYAQGTNTDAKVVFHVTDHLTGKGTGCALDLSGAQCDATNTSAGLGASYDIFVLIRQGNPTITLAGASIGLYYDGVAAGVDGNPPLPGAGIVVFGWTNCADQEFAQSVWPNTGSGNVIAFDAINNCQTGDPGDGRAATLGWLYVYPYDTGQMAIRNHPPSGALKVADCGAAESTIPETNGGVVSVSAGAVTAGCNPCTDAPCFTTAVEERTWGGIKNMFRAGE